MWYFKKKDILEHFGKDGKNVRWLDRAIKKWIVIHTNGMYISRHDYDLQRMIKMKTEIKELKEKAEWWDADLVRWLKSDLAFQIEENERQKKEFEDEIEWIIERCFNHMAEHKCLPMPTKKEFTYWAKWISTKDIQFSHEELMDNNFVDLPF